MEIGFTNFDRYMIFFIGDSQVWPRDKYEIFMESIRVYQRNASKGILQIEDKLAAVVKNSQKDGIMAGLSGRVFNVEGLSKRNDKETSFDMKYLIPFSILEYELKEE